MSWSRFCRATFVAVLAALALGSYASAASASNYRDVVLQTSGLVGFWRIGETSGTAAADETGAQSGAYNGGVTLGTPGALYNDPNPSAQIGGSSWFSVPNRSAYQVNGFSVEMWVYLTSYGDTSTWRVLADKGRGLYVRNWMVSLAAGTQGQVSYSFSDGGTFQSGGSTANLALNRWYHLVFTHVPGTKIQLFVNGQLDSEKATTTTPVTSTDGVEAVNQGTSPRVDELALYNRPLSASEVSQHYQAGTSTDTTPPDTVISSGPSGPITSSSATYGFNSTETGSTFECSFDGAAWSPCSSPKTYSGLTVGSHTFSVRARDAAGNVDASPATRTIQYSGPCTASLGSFGIDAWPPACWRPYADTSPFNQQLPANPRVDPDSASYVTHVAGTTLPANLGASSQDLGDDYGHPTYYSNANDPTYRISCTQPWGTCPFGSDIVHIPAGARQASGTDGHMAVVDQTSGTEYDMWQVQSITAGSPGTVTTSWGGKIPVTGDGRNSGATASLFGNLGGIVRAQELNAGQINHALFMVIPCVGSHGSTWSVYPALTDNGAHCSTNASLTAPMGSRFQLNMTDAEINALSAPTWRKTIYRAMAHYGMYVGDTGGDPNHWGVSTESDMMYQALGRPRLLFNFAQNNGWTPWNNVLVGGFGDYSTNASFDGIDWNTRLRVIDPCVAQGTC